MANTPDFDDEKTDPDGSSTQTVDPAFLSLAAEIRALGLEPEDVLPTLRKLEPDYFELKRIGSVVWIRWMPRVVPSRARHLLWTGTSWSQVWAAESGLTTALALMPDLDLTSAVDIFQGLGGTPLTTFDAAHQLTSSSAFQKPIPQEALARWSPPSDNDARFSFCALTNSGFGLLSFPRDGTGHHFELYAEAARWPLRGRAYGDVLPELRGASEPSPHTSAQAWREAARGEQASIASFARASMELLAVGAPMDWVARCHEAALDEIAHARMSLELAQSIDGHDVELGPLPALPARPPTLARVGIDTLREAAIPETIAVALAQAALPGTTDPAARTLLETILRDERRHAELAWDIVAWCAREPDVQSAIESALASVPELAFGFGGDPALGCLDAQVTSAIAREAFQTEIIPRLLRLKTPTLH